MRTIPAGSVTAHTLLTERTLPTTVDVSDLTDDQLFAERRILRECRERIEAVHAGKHDPLMIEAGAGTVIEMTGSEPEG
jgi:hypothetical protein